GDDRRRGGRPSTPRGRGRTTTARPAARGRAARRAGPARRRRRAPLRRRERGPHGPERQRHEHAPAAPGRRGRVRRPALAAPERRVVPGRLAVAAVRPAAGESVALMGPNGSGKSTLLRLLAGEAASADPRSRLAYAPGLRLVHVGQEDRGLAHGEPVLDQLAR